jgi:hypothetical protein
MAPGLDEFDVSGDNPEPNALLCVGDQDVMEVKVTAINAAQIKMPNAWDAMLQWYEVSPVIH